MFLPPYTSPCGRMNQHTPAIVAGVFVFYLSESLFRGHKQETWKHYGVHVC